MDNRPIGIFDSGLGGISVLRDIVKLMPNENYIYYGDSAHAPYGTKSLEEIQALSDACVSFLLNKDVKAIVIACNTATSAAAGLLRSKYINLPIIGIEPALKPAVLWKEHDKVAVMATPMTLQQDKFKMLMHTYEGISDIFCIPCPGLADYVEKGIFDGPEITAFLEGLLRPYLEKGIDAIVLGCTHYPFVKKVISHIAGENVRIFDGSHGTALELKRRLEISGLLTNNNAKGEISIFNSNDSPAIIQLCHTLLNQPE
ncbi:MAG: glutamate racemase [Coprococcus sp.]